MINGHVGSAPVTIEMDVQLRLEPHEALALVHSRLEALRRTPLSVLVDQSFSTLKITAAGVRDLVSVLNQLAPGDVQFSAKINKALKKSSPFFADDVIAADTYKGVGQVRTLAVGAQWVTSDKADAATVYEIVKALYGDAGQKALAAGHAKGKFITKENAVQGAGIPFHPGAEKFYKEAGVLK